MKKLFILLALAFLLDGCKGYSYCFLTNCSLPPISIESDHG